MRGVGCEKAAVPGDRVGKINSDSEGPNSPFGRHYHLYNKVALERLSGSSGTCGFSLGK